MAGGRTTTSSLPPTASKKVSVVKASSTTCMSMKPCSQKTPSAEYFCPPARMFRLVTAGLPRFELPRIRFDVFLLTPVSSMQSSICRVMPLRRSAAYHAAMRASSRVGANELIRLHEKSSFLRSASETVFTVGGEESQVCV